MEFELFFVISAFLFFRLFALEADRTGDISISNFYVRRLLRLYPLMIAFPLAMILIFGQGTSIEWSCWLGLAAFVDNFQAWFDGYSQIPFSIHLWTLSFEYQLYLIFPFVFLAYRSLGAERFGWMLLGVWAIALVARAAFILAGARHPIIWVTPFLRPETTLLGILLAIQFLPRLSVAMVLGAGVLAVAVLTQVPNVENVGPGTMLLYPVVAVFCGALVWLCLNSDWIARAFSTRGMAFLGSISFGLYVYHWLGLWMTKAAFAWAGISWDGALYFLFMLIAVVITAALSIVSYYGFERIFLRPKARFTAVESRPI